LGVFNWKIGRLGVRRRCNCRMPLCKHQVIALAAATGRE
jgi:hypothetical protein